MRFRYFFRAGAILLAIGLAAVTTVAYAAPPQHNTNPPEPSIAPGVDMVPANPGIIPSTGKAFDRTPLGAPPLGPNWGAFHFDDNPVYNGGFYYIPPDPMGAAGPFHVVNVGNCMIQWFSKGGVLQNHQGLSTFFAPTPLGTSTFDPKVTYDQYADRFVVITLERTTAPTGSYILIAVSQTNDPNGGWYFAAINSKLLISGVETWADYPGLAVDDKAIYITNNMFTFGGAYAGNRQWIIDKNPLYAGGPISFGVYDAYSVAAPGFDTTTQPTHMYGALPANIGTYFVSYSGLTYGGPGAIEAVLVIHVTDPLGLGGGPFFTGEFVNCTDIEDVGGIFGFPALPDAPQAGTPILVEVNDRRALNAVWRNNNLYMCATIIPNAGADAGQTTAHWWRINTSAGIGGLVCSDEGNVGGEDICPDTYTFFPSVAVDKCDNMSIGFALSATCMYPSAGYTGRLVGDPAGTTQPTGILAAGVDFYNRWFNGPRNRWGDYSGMAIDPADDATFWVFNEYAGPRGTILGCCPTEDGRWLTQWGSFTLGCAPVAVAVSNFEARMTAGGVELKAVLHADDGNVRVNVYRGANGAEPIRYKSVELGIGREFAYVDANVEPGKKYSYYLGAVDLEGEFFSPRIDVFVPGVVTALHPNKPNPFNPATSIRFDLAEAAHVTISVYDAAGRLVRTLVDRDHSAGIHNADWDGRDNAGRVAPSGVYFARMQAGKFAETRKMVLMK